MVCLHAGDDSVIDDIVFLNQWDKKHRKKEYEEDLTSTTSLAE